MAFEKGNKLALGYGRPHNEGFSNEEVEKIGHELIDWINEKEKLDQSPVHLSEFYSELKGICRTQWRSLQVRPCFLPYYERASEWMGKKLLLNRKIPTTYGMKFLGHYFKEIADYEDERMKVKVDYEYDKKAAIDLRNQSTQETQDTKTQIENAKLIYENEQLKKEIEEFKNAKSKTDNFVQ